jgi:hypothetical protein
MMNPTVSELLAAVEPEAGPEVDELDDGDEQAATPATSAAAAAMALSRILGMRKPIDGSFFGGR